MNPDRSFCAVAIPPELLHCDAAELLRCEDDPELLRCTGSELSCCDDFGAFALSSFRRSGAVVIRQRKAVARWLRLADSHG